MCAILVLSVKLWKKNRKTILLALCEPLTNNLFVQDWPAGLAFDRPFMMCAADGCGSLALLKAAFYCPLLVSVLLALLSIGRPGCSAHSWLLGAGMRAVHLLPVSHHPAGHLSVSCCRSCGSKDPVHMGLKLVLHSFSCVLLLKPQCSAGVKQVVCWLSWNL